MSRTNDGRTSGWLSALPLVHHHFDLSSVKFRDALALWYHRFLPRVPSVCDGCGASFSLCHTLGCRKGGLVTQHHNEIRDALGDLLATGYKEVLIKPIVREADDSTNTSALVADLRVRGCVAATDCGIARCACCWHWHPVIYQPFSECCPLRCWTRKEKKILRSCRGKTLLLHTLCALGGRLMGPEASCFLKRVAEQLSFIGTSHILLWLGGWKCGCSLLQHMPPISVCKGPEPNGEVQQKWRMDVDGQCCTSNAQVLFASLVICYTIIVLLLSYFCCKTITFCHHHCGI